MKTHKKPIKSKKPGQAGQVLTAAKNGKPIWRNAKKEKEKPIAFESGRIILNGDEND